MGRSVLCQVRSRDTTCRCRGRSGRHGLGAPNNVVGATDRGHGRASSTGTTCGGQGAAVREGDGAALPGQVGQMLLTGDSAGGWRRRLEHRRRSAAVPLLEHHGCLAGCMYATEI